MQQIRRFLRDDYIGNLSARSGCLNWLDNKWVNAIGSIALCADATVASYNTLFAEPLVVILGLLSLGKKVPIITEKKGEVSPSIGVDKRLCKNLSEQTGYLFQLPHKEELKGVKDYAIPSCIVLRLKENTTLLAKIKNKKLSK